MKEWSKNTQLYKIIFDIDRWYYEIFVYSCMPFEDWLNIPHAIQKITQWMYLQIYYVQNVRN